MNILIINSSKGSGGIESHSVTLASALLKKKQTVYLACPAGSPVERNAMAHSVPVIDFSLTNPADIKAIFKLKNILSVTAADVLIVNLGKDYWPATVTAKLAGKRIVLIRHQADRLKKATRWLLSNHVNRIVAVSRFIRDWMVGYGIPFEKIQVIHNAVDFREFTSLYSERDQARKEFGIEADDVVIGFVGTMTEGKGIFELLKAFYALAFGHPRLKLLYVGDGPDMEELKKEAQVLQGRVIFAGHRKDVARLYAAMDIFVLPSTCREAFGMALIEAMSMGKPVIATRTGGIPEIIEHRTNGLIVPPADYSALARAILELTEAPSLREKLALNAIESVALKFSDDVFGDSFTRLLKEVCDLD
jgi:glycosyltransferase involved in cell wall biosynthesis